MFKKILFWAGAALPFFIIPIHGVWSYILMFIAILLISVLPVIGSAVGFAAWIWALIVVFSRPFAWYTIPVILFGLFCIIEFGFAFLSDTGLIKSR